MAGGDEVGPDLLAVRPELAELEPDVAEDARVGGPAGGVFVGELVHDPGEVAFEVEGIERDVEAVGDGSGVDRVGARAAGLGPSLEAFAVGSGAHEEADDLVPLLLQQVRGHRAINPPAHRQHDPAAHRNDRLRPELDLDSLDTSRIGGVGLNEQVESPNDESLPRGPVQIKTLPTDRAGKVWCCKGLDGRGGGLEGRAM